MHEFTHAIDADTSNITIPGEPSGDKYIPNGIFDEMSQTEKNIFAKESSKLVIKYSNFRKNLTKDEKAKVNSKDYDPATGLRNYAFTNPLEFLASMVETFYDAPLSLFRASRKMYNLLKDFLKF